MRNYQAVNRLIFFKKSGCDWQSICDKQTKIGYRMVIFGSRVAKARNSRKNAPFVRL